MEGEIRADSKLKYEFGDGGYSLFIANEGRGQAAMRKILGQLERKFEGKLQTAPLYNGDNTQIIFKQGCIPTGREIIEIMSAIDTHITPEEEASGVITPEV